MVKRSTVARRTKRNTKRNRTKKQKMYKMIGCAKCGANCRCVGKCKCNCAKCGPNCRCVGKCKCKHPCPGNCGSRRQRGGMGCGPAGCPIAPYPMKGGNCDVMGCDRALGTYQNGGSCAVCGSTPVIASGGGFYKPPAPMPGPFIGESWGGLVNKWPGVDGVGSNRNYLELNTYPSDPQTMMKIRGGRRKRKTQKRQYGGSFMPRDLVNLGRDFTSNLKTAYNALNTIPKPASPLPFKDQLN